MKNLLPIKTIEGVIEAFINGEEAQTSNGSLSSVKMNDGGEIKTYLMGYGWAIYAERWNGQFYFHAGWYGYSATTSKHYNKAHALCGRAAGPMGVCMQDEDKPSMLF